MPSFDLYNKMLKAKTIGEAHKLDSDMVMEATWDTDINTRTCYLYDYWHDDHKTQLKNLDSPNDAKKVAISLKWRKSSNQTFSSDTVTHHIQMKPSQKMNVDYYPEFFGDKYDSIFPIGLYVDIVDERGVYNRWLVVGVANYYVSQFPTFEVLPCDYIFDWVYKGKKFKMAGCLRSQSSYNSGVWLDYKIESPEDQQKCILPMNSLTEKLFYNQRMIIDNRVDVRTGAEPRAWKVSKINRISSNGTVMLTFAQGMWDEHTDYIEYDGDTIVGMWADYYSKDGTSPQDEDLTNVHATVSYSGNGVIKVGGGYKKLAVSFYDEETPIDLMLGHWTFAIDGQDASTLVETTDEEGDHIKVKFIGSEDYMGKSLVVSYETYKGIKGSAELAIRGI